MLTDHSMRIGHIQSLVVARVEADRLVLADEFGAEVDLVRDSTTPPCAVGDRLEVFIRSDRDSRPLASLKHPVVTLGQCAALTVAATGPGGVYLDWGLDKHLLLPFAEQRRPRDVGQLESVLVYLDSSGRLAASSRLDHHLADTPSGFRAGQSVELLIFQRTDLGFKAVVDDRAIGLVYKDEVFRNLGTGSRLQGHVRRVRSDGRLDLSVQPPVHEAVDELEQRILARLSLDGGENTLGDRSPPEAIRDAFQVSKKVFKKALSSLYKARRVRLEPTRTVLVDESVEIDLDSSGVADDDSGGAGTVDPTDDATR